jgi:hypothetical protein
MAIQRLTAAFRSRSRPSSTLGAKASTVCPYYLDGDLGKSLAALPGDTRVIGICAVFKVREEVRARLGGPGPGPASRRPRAGLSKLNSMRPFGSGASARPCGLPGPVDMSSGRSRSGERRELESSGTAGEARGGRSAGDRCPLVEEGSLERR